MKSLSSLNIIGARKIVSTSMKNRSDSSNHGEPLVKKKRHWREGLLETLEDPEYKIMDDEQITMIKDKYPKSHHHYLVIPKDNIHSIKEVTKEHEDLLLHMEKIGQRFADEHKNYEFILGYHAVPSMHRLHLHVISTDFDSPCLKTKQHWNSFTTPFFLSSHTVREQLKEHGRIKQMSSSDGDVHLKKDLQCHKCTYRPKNMPDLKRHLVTHLSVK